MSKESWNNFLILCSQMQSPEEFDHFFNLFLTIEEKENLAARYLIVKALLNGELTQREMSEEYHVSIAQVTRGSNALKMIDPEFKKQLMKRL
jgi:TrpR family transcriptional regulator, trp operon repressor